MTHCQERLDSAEGAADEPGADGAAGSRRQFKVLSIKELGDWRTRKKFEKKTSDVKGNLEADENDLVFDLQKQFDIEEMASSLQNGSSHSRGSNATEQ